MKPAFAFSLLLCLCSVLSDRPSIGQVVVSRPAAPPARTTLQTGSISGTILDPDGAVIPDADITLAPAPGAPTPSQATHTSSEGRYNLRAVPPGSYVLRVVAKGFAAFESQTITIAAARLQTINVQVGLATAKVDVDVSGDSALDTDPNRNADAVILRGSALDGLSPDPAIFAQQIRNLSSGDAPAIYVDNFSSGIIPPRSSIREIRINQNAYSARNDTDPVNGLIEIFTKPGTDKLHATFYMVGSNSSFDSRNPFITSQPPYYFTQSEGDLGGSFSHKASYFLNFLRHVQASNAVVDAETLDSSLLPVELTEALPSPATDTTVAPRLDFQRGDRSTIDLRYSWLAHRQTNAGVGGLNLPDQGFQTDAVTQTIQAGDSQILSERVVDDMRLQYVRTRTRQTPASTAPSLDVEGAFAGGGNTSDAVHDNQDRFEVQDYVAIQAGRQYLTPGVRVRVDRDANVSLANYNGQYVFPSLAAYQAAQQSLTQCLQSLPASNCTASGASQFSMTTGNPNATVTVSDLAVFFQDDWKLGRQFTLSYGLRYEVQNHMADLGDLGPRIALSWGIGGTDKKPPRVVLRAGSGVFFTRLPTQTILQATRQNGVSQASYIIANPTFYPLIPSLSSLGPQSLPTIFHIQPGFHSPYTWNSTISLDHALGTHGALSVSYVFSRGVHLGLTRNINAPEPGTYDPGVPTSGVRPLRSLQNVEQYESTGVSRAHRVFGSVNLHTRGNAYLYSSYTLRLRNTDATSQLPSNAYNLSADYGRAPIPEQMYVLEANGPIARTRVNLSGYLYVTSGTPFNITVGQDLNGDSQFNDRPAFATNLSRPSVIQTAYGTFDTNPVPGQTIIPINYGTGPAQISTNIQVYRNFTFGPPVAGSPGATVSSPGGKQYINRKFNLMLGVEAQNPLNHVNLDTPVGVLGSPLFGKSTGLTGGATTNANRVINLLLEARF